MDKYVGKRLDGRYEIREIVGVGGMAVVYKAKCHLLNRYVAFRATQQRTTKQLFRYALSVVGSILLNYALMKLFVDLCHIWPTIAKIFTTVIVATYSYMAAKYYSFTQARQ